MQPTGKGKNAGGSSRGSSSRSQPREQQQQNPEASRQSPPSHSTSTAGLPESTRATTRVHDPYADSRASTTKTASPTAVRIGTVAFTLTQRELILPSHVKAHIGDYVHTDNDQDLGRLIFVDTALVDPRDTTSGIVSGSVTKQLPIAEITRVASADAVKSYLHGFKDYELDVTNEACRLAEPFADVIDVVAVEVAFSSQDLRVLFKINLDAADKKQEGGPQQQGEFSWKPHEPAADDEQRDVSVSTANEKQVGAGGLTMGQQQGTGCEGTSSSDPSDPPPLVQPSAAAAPQQLEKQHGKEGIDEMPQRATSPQGTDQSRSPARVKSPVMKRARPEEPQSEVSSGGSQKEPSTPSRRSDTSNDSDESALKRKKPDEASKSPRDELLSESPVGTEQPVGQQKPEDAVSSSSQAPAEPKPEAPRSKAAQKRGNMPKRVDSAIRLLREELAKKYRTKVSFMYYDVAA